MDRSNGGSMNEHAGYNEAMIAREGRRRSVFESDVGGRDVI